MLKTPEYPTALATSLQHLDDVPMPQARVVINDNFAYLDAKPGGSGGGLGDPGANGLVKRTSFNVTSMAVAGTDYQAALGFTPENVSNKNTDGTMAANSDVLYPSQKAVKTYAVPAARQVLAGSGMGGGGALGADVTLTANVTSVFGRTGAVTLATSDIITAGGVPSSRLISTDATLTGGGDLSANRTLSVVADSVVEQVRISSAGGLVGTRREINFINGANVTCSVTDVPGSNRVDVSIASTGGGSGGMVDPTTTLGDLIVGRTSATPTRLGVGTNGLVLTADSAQVLGLKWGTAVSTIFGRSGVVVAQTGDYTAAQVGAVPTARQVIAGSGMSGGGALSVDVTLNANVTSVFGRTGAVTLTAGDVAGAGGVPNTRQIIAGTGMTGGGDLTVDRTLSAKAMGPSGASHSVGSVPDPGATAGITRFLREDAAWVVPPAPTSGPAASAYMTGASPTFLMGVATAVPFNATEFDSSGGSMHSDTVNPTRLVAPSAGYYLVIANHQFASGATGTVAKLAVNGADVIGSQTQAVITAFVAITATAVVHLNANDYVEYVITAVTADALVFTFTDAPRAAPRCQLIRLF